MTTAKAEVSTTNGAKYVQQLCKHWAHKLDVDIEGNRGVVNFPGCTATMIWHPESIEITLEGADPSEVERLTDVVARHLDRFAFREAPLDYNWSVN